jgi:low temperature requirement protein LtrA
VSRSHPDRSEAVRSFAALSVGGLGCALLGGYLGGQTQLWLWAMTIFLDVVAAVAAADSEKWHLHPEHFAERHGLIVIIALGESLIVAAAALVDQAFSGHLLVVTILAVLTTCALWWTYFPLAKPQLERALAEADPRNRSRLGRDAFSLAHFPMLCGVIAFAVGLEAALHDPEHALGTGGRLSIALGLLLFLGGTALAQWRATCGNPLPRVALGGITALAISLLSGAAPVATLGVALAGVVVVAATDEVRAKRLA